LERPARFINLVVVMAHQAARKDLPPWVETTNRTKAKARDQRLE